MFKTKEISHLLIGIMGGVLLFDAIVDIYTTIMINRTVKRIVDKDRILEAETTEE